MGQFKKAELHLHNAAIEICKINYLKLKDDYLKISNLRSHVKIKSCSSLIEKHLESSQITESTTLERYFLKLIDDIQAKDTLYSIPPPSSATPNDGYSTILQFVSLLKNRRILPLENDRIVATCMFLCYLVC